MRGKIRIHNWDEEGRVINTKVISLEKLAETNSEDYFSEYGSRITFTIDKRSNLESIGKNLRKIGKAQLVKIELDPRDRRSVIHNLNSDWTDKREIFINDVIEKAKDNQDKTLSNNLSMGARSLFSP